MSPRLPVPRAEWTVYLEAEAPGIDLDAAAAVSVRIPQAYGAAVGSGSDSLTATLTIRNDDISKAVHDAIVLITDVAALADITLGPVVRAEIMTTELADRELEQPATVLGGLQEVAAALGVSKQRVAELRDRPGFPAPVAQLASGPVWDMAQLARFQAEWKRTPGRPRKTPIGSNLVVVEEPDGGWAVELEDAESSVAPVFDTQEAAIDHARAMLRNSGGGELRVKTRDGTVAQVRVQLQEARVARKGQKRVAARPEARR